MSSVYSSICFSTLYLPSFLYRYVRSLFGARTKASTFLFHFFFFYAVTSLKLLFCFTNYITGSGNPPLSHRLTEERRAIENINYIRMWATGGYGDFPPLSHQTTHRNMCDTMNNNPTSTHQKTVSFLFNSSLLSHHNHRQRIYALHHEEITQQLSSY